MEALHRTSDRGAALILTLLILSFLAALGAALLTSTTLDIWLVDNYRTRMQALYLAESGVEQGRELLRTSGPTTNQPFLTGGWTTGTYQVSLQARSAGTYVLTSVGETGNSKRTIEATVRKGGFPADPLDPVLSSVRGLERLVTAISSNAADRFPGGTVIGNYGSSTDRRVAAVGGDATLGPGTGYGLLLVTGQLRIVGPLWWTGLIVVIGQGVVTRDPDPFVQITGGIFAARTRDVGGQPLAAPAAASFEVTEVDEIVRANAPLPYALISVREN